MKTIKFLVKTVLILVLFPVILMAQDYPEIPCVSRWGTAMPTGIQDMVVSEPYAYVLSGTWDYHNRLSRLGIIDYTDITHPVDAGFIFLPVSRTEKLAIDGNLLAVTADSSLILVNIEEPLAPVYYNPHTFQSKTLGVGLTSDYAYVTLADSTLYIFDVSNPRQPRGIDIIDLPHQCNQILIQDDRAFLTGERLLIYDVSSPEEPTYIGSFDEPCFSVVQWQNYLYAARGDSGLAVVELREREDPRIVRRIDARTMDVQIQDGKLFTVGLITHVWDGQIDFDITEICSYSLDDPSDPQFDESARLSMDHCEGFKRFGEALITWTPYIQFIPELSPLQIGSNFEYSRSTSHLLIHEQGGFVSYSNRCLIAYDLSDPYHPVGADTLNSVIYSVNPFKVRNNDLYTASNGYFHLYNIDDLHNLTEESVIRTRTPNFLKADFSTHYMYIIYDNIISCSGTWNHYQFVDSLHLDADLNDLAVLPDANVFVAARSEGLLSFEFSERHHFQQIDQLDFPSDVEACAIKDDRLYACGEGVYIVDISNPSSLSWIGTIELPGVNSLIAIDGNHAVVSSRVGYREPDREFGFFLLGITDTDEPNIIGRYSTNFYHKMPMQVSLSNSFIYVRSRYDYSAYDASDLMEIPVDSTPHLLDYSLTATISPNPTNAAAKVFFNLPAPGEINMTLFDPFGREVMKWSPARYYPVGENTLSLDAATLPSGTYFMQLNSGVKQAVSPLIIAK